VNAAASSPAPAVPAAAAPPDRVPLGQKIAYGLGTFNDMWGHWLYHSVAFPIFNIALQVRPELVGWALFVNRLVDAFSDPFFGWRSDQTRTRFGRRRPYILVGGVLSGVLLPGLFMVSRGWSEWQIFAFMLASSALYIPLMSCYNMPYQSLGAEMTPDYHERTSVMSWKLALQKVGEVGLFCAMAFTTLAWFRDPETGQPDMLLGIRVYTAILGVLMAAISVGLFFVIRERYYVRLAAQPLERVGLRASLAEALRCRPFRIQLGMTLAFAIGTSMVGALGYYATIYHVCGGDLTLGNRWNFAMGLSGLAGGVIGAPAFGWLARRRGKRHAAACVLAFGALAFGGTWWTYNPALPWLQLLASGSIAAATAGFWMLTASMGADVMDFDELGSGRRREGAFASCNSWIVKFGLALGALASGNILAATGFDAALPAQTAETVRLIRVLLASVPLAGIALAFVLLARFPLTQARMAEIRAQLEARRGAV